MQTFDDVMTSDYYYLPQGSIEVKNNAKHIYMLLYAVVLAAYLQPQQHVSLEIGFFTLFCITKTFLA